MLAAAACVMLAIASTTSRQTAKLSLLACTVGAYGICEGSSDCDPDDQGSIVIDAVIAARA